MTSLNDHHPDGSTAARRHELPSWLADAERLDLAVYEVIAATETPTLDCVLST